METGDIERLIYLVVLGSAIGGYFLISSRHELGKRAKEAAVWVLIIFGLVAGYGLWEDVRNDVAPQQSYIAQTGQISVPQSPDGPYYLTLEIDGTPVRFVVDTGASEMVLSLADATRAGIDVDGLAFLGRAQTANGLVRTAGVTLSSVQLGDFTDRDFRASVNGGEMDGSLLGMTYLDRYDSLEIKDRELILTR